jgi:lipopolysaccharide biosynthesis glycosyltransferase
LIWLDADIVINNAIAPSIMAAADDKHIGAVRYHAIIGQPIFEVPHRAMCHGKSASEWNAFLFKMCGLAADPEYLLNTGVMVVPRAQFSFLARVFEKYKNAPIIPQQQEQVPLSYEMYSVGLTRFLDEKFNAVWYEYKFSVYFGDGPREFNRSAIQRIFSQVYFLHFAGNHNDMMLLSM